MHNFLECEFGLGPLFKWFHDSNAFFCCQSETLSYLFAHSEGRNEFSAWSRGSLIRFRWLRWSGLGSYQEEEQWFHVLTIETQKRRHPQQPWSFFFPVTGYGSFGGMRVSSLRLAFLDPSSESSELACSCSFSSFSNFLYEAWAKVTYASRSLAV